MPSRNRLTTSVSSLPAAKAVTRKRRARQSWPTVLRPIYGWQRARWMRRKLAALSTPVRIAVVVAAILVLVPVVNAVYQVIRKPTELFFFVGTALDKEPAETWQQYEAYFRAYSTDTVTPELLAALAQTESAGNPVARTYWRWRLTWNPFAAYKPASSAVGLYQMTDPAFAEASRYCIRGHTVVATDCRFNNLYIRVLPSHATELAAAYLDLNVAGVLASMPNRTASSRHKQDLAALIHLCGAGPARAFMLRGFRPAAGERCGDHLVAAYLAKVNGMKRQFLGLAANDKN